MSAPKQYTVKKFVPANDPEIAAVLAKHPLWKPKHARDLLARMRFQESITKAGK
jgi:hypothetical protein